MTRSSRTSGDMEMARSERDAGYESEERRRESGVSKVSSKSRAPLQSALSVRTTHSRYDRYSRANDDDETEGAGSTVDNYKPGCFKRMKASIAAFMSDMFGSEFDFGAAYRRAKGISDGYQSSVTTRTDQPDQIRAWEHLSFFPLTFKDAKFETQYALICSQLFIGRLFIVLIALVFLVIPILWLLGALCLLDIELNVSSVGAWIAFHAAFATNLLIALTSLILTTFPKICPSLRKYFEFYAYLNVFAWLSMLLIVLSTYPTLVKAPTQMELLWSVDTNAVSQVVQQGHPTCSALQTLPGLQQLLTCMQAGTATECASRCLGGTLNGCKEDIFKVIAADAHFCQDMASAILNNFQTLGHHLDHLWFPFVLYLPYVKLTLQVFKVPIVAGALIICVFGTGLMFLDTMSPSRTKMTMAMHLLVVPLCSLPFILLHRTYPSVVPVEETLLFVFSFFFVAAAGWVGRYAQEFQHRLIFCSWRLTTNMLQDLHRKMQNQKEAKKSSTAIEELIFQVKECNNIIRMARLRGPRADVTDELFHAEQLLEKILEVLTASGNLYSVRFTDAAKENDVQRQFIELYNESEQHRKDDAVLNKAERMTTHSRSVLRQGTTVSKMHEAARVTNQSAFGSGLSSSGPVSGFEFNAETFKQSLASGQVDEMYALWRKMPTPEATHQLLASVGVDWDFDILAFGNTTENVLLEVGYALLCRLVGDWGCEESQLIRFLVTIEGQYLPNPYHNKLHGATVAHLTECLTRMLNAQRTMNSVDKATLTVAAICHDVGHPGRNNQFFVNCYDPLAVIYNDQAVLENFHSCLTFRTLEIKECNVFVNLEDSEFRYIRQNLIACILATDMKQHFESITRFRVRRNSPEFSYSKKQEDLWLVARMCVKVADIGHSSVQWAQHFQWSCRVVEEFYQQGEEELARGLAISPLCDPEKHADMAKSQNGFLEFVVKPLLKEIEEIEPFAHIKNTVSKHLAYNISKWQILQEGGRPIVLSTTDHSGKTTVTASAVRKIAGIKRGPPQRSVAGGTSTERAPLNMPTLLRTDLERVKEEEQHEGSHSSEGAAGTLAEGASSSSADPPASEDRQQDAGHQQLPVPQSLPSRRLQENVDLEEEGPEDAADGNATVELGSPSGSRRRVRISSMTFLESSSRQPTT